MSLYVCDCPSYNCYKLEEHEDCPLGRYLPHSHDAQWSMCRGNEKICRYSSMMGNRCHCIPYVEIPLEEEEYLERLGMK